MNYSPYVDSYAVPERRNPDGTAAPRHDGTPDLLPVMSPPDAVRSVLLPAVTAGLALLAGITLIALSFAYPTNAPAEVIGSWFTAFGLFAVTIAGGVLALVFGLQRRSRREAIRGYRAFVEANPGVREIPRPVSERPWLLAMWGFVLSGGSLLLWLLTGFLPTIVVLADQHDLHYAAAAWTLWGWSWAWFPGWVLAAAGARRDGGPTTARFAVTGVVLGALSVIPALSFAIVYALGLSD